MRRVIVLVFPVPAPASTQTGPRAASTASRCSSSSSSRCDDGACTGMASIMAARTDNARAADGHVGGLGYVCRVMTAALTMYTTSWCGYCFRLKTMLKAEGIPFTEVDIESDPAAAEFVMSVNGGNQTVPTLKFADGSTLTNPSAREVKAKLAA
jgi:mycoredoxin